MTTKLKVLVFDDVELHRQSATLLLGKDYDLTVVGTYDEAQKALVSGIDYDKREQIFKDLLENAGLKRDFNPYQGDKDAPEENKQKYHAANKEASKLAMVHPDFDIVLTDLLVPASRQAQGGEGMKFVGQEMPLGTTIALYALCAGVKKVAVVTDMNHHHHPASAAFDYIDGRRCKLEGVNIICTNDVHMIWIDEMTGEVVEPEFLYTDEGKAKYPEDQKTYERKGLVKGGKDWKQVLLKLTGEFKEE